MNQALSQFLDAVEAETQRVVALVITSPAIGTLSAINERYPDAARLPGYMVSTPEDLADRVAKLVVRMRTDGQDTMIVDLSDTNGTWLQATPFDYQLRALLDNGPDLPPNLTVKRIILVSSQRGFKLSPAIMARMKMVEVAL